MEQLTIHIKDASKRTFLLELLRQFEFVELQIKAQQPVTKQIWAVITFLYFL